ncbi:general substrate transporter [Hypoxylon sp. FL1857]|nr:general substrate transporter [Hypoxylon sp. FL1857]
MASLREQIHDVRRLFNKTLALSVGLIAFSQFNFGFDQTAYSTTQAMDAFERQFGEYNAKKDTWVIDANFLAFLNSLPYIGFVVGLLIGSEISSRYGRRMIMFVMSIYALCTAAITFSSQSRAQILTARILNYAYVGMELAVVPVFQSEIVPKQVRGLVVETYQLMLFFGGLIMSLICFGTSNLEGNKQWQIPFGLFFVIPAIVAACIWFVPESPRWLLMKGRDEDAIKALRRLRIGCFTEEEMEMELEALRVILAEEVEQGSYWDLWKGINLKRTLIACGVNFFLQLTGNTFANKYGTVYIKSLGSVDPFVMTIVNQLVSLLGVVVSMSLVDRWGRRQMLFFGGAIQIVALYTMAGLGTPQKVTPGMQQGIIAMLSIFGFGFCSGWAPVSHILTAEIPSSRLRDMTYRTASAVNIIVQFATTFATPYLLDAPYAALGSKVGFIFGSAAVLATVFAYFCVPECKGRTLEEIDRLFLDNVPIRKFKTTNVLVTGDDEGDMGKGAKIEVIESEQV